MLLWANNEAMLLYGVKHTLACNELKVPIMLILPSSQNYAHSLTWKVANLSQTANTGRSWDTFSEPSMIMDHTFLVKEKVSPVWFRSSFPHISLVGFQLAWDTSSKNYESTKFKRLCYLHWYRLYKHVFKMWTVLVWFKRSHQFWCWFSF